MTITALSKQLNVSTMTIYRRCKKHGVKLDSLRDEVTGELTSDGVAVIASLFDATRPEQALTGDATRMQQVTQPVAQTASQGQLDVLQAKLDGMTALVGQLTGERDALREQLAAAQAALAAEIQDRQAERRLLAAGATDPGGDPPEPARRRWRWPWARD